MLSNPQLHPPLAPAHIYLATVVDNQDPLELARCRVRIHELHGSPDDIPDEHLPWAFQLRPTHSGSGPNLGSYAIPAPNARVIVSLDRGSIYAPYYHAEPYIGGAEVDGAGSEYPDSYGHRDRKGNLYGVNMGRDTAEVDFGGDVAVNVSAGAGNEGTVASRVSGSGYARFGGKVVLEAAKDVVVEGQRRLVLIAGGEETDGMAVEAGSPVGGTMVRTSGRDSLEAVGRNKETRVEGDSQENVAGEKLVEAGAGTAAVRLAVRRVEVYADEVRIGDEGAKALALYAELKAAFDGHRHALPTVAVVSPPTALPPMRLTSAPKGPDGVTDQGLPANVATTKAKGI